MVDPNNAPAPMSQKLNFTFTSGPNWARKLVASSFPLLYTGCLTGIRKEWFMIIIRKYNWVVFHPLNFLFNLNDQVFVPLLHFFPHPLELSSPDDGKVFLWLMTFSPRRWKQQMKDLVTTEPHTMTHVENGNILQTLDLIHIDWLDLTWFLLGGNHYKQKNMWDTGFFPDCRDETTFLREISIGDKIYSTTWGLMIKQRHQTTSSAAMDR